MTRYHYIKKAMYLQYRLAMLPTTTNRHYDTSYAKWNAFTPYPPFANGAQTCNRKIFTRNLDRI